MKHLLLFASLLLACTPDDPGPSATDAATDASTDAPVCCPMEAPSHDCYSTGAHDPLTHACMRVCDSNPTRAVRMTGADGCPYWYPAS